MLTTPIQLPFWHLKPWTPKILKLLALLLVKAWMLSLLGCEHAEANTHQAKSASTVDSDLINM